MKNTESSFSAKTPEVLKMVASATSSKPFRAERLDDGAAFSSEPTVIPICTGSTTALALVDTGAEVDLVQSENRHIRCDGREQRVLDRRYHHGGAR